MPGNGQSNIYDEEEEYEYKPIPKQRGGLASFFNVNKPMPKIKQIRNNGIISIVFNNRMIFPENFLDLV